MFSKAAFKIFHGRKKKITYGNPKIVENFHGRDFDFHGEKKNADIVYFPDILLDFPCIPLDFHGILVDLFGTPVYFSDITKGIPCFPMDFAGILDDFLDIIPVNFLGTSVISLTFQ